MIGVQKERVGKKGGVICGWQTVWKCTNVSREFANNENLSQHP